jgi:hypothetical protein
VVEPSWTNGGFWQQRTAHKGKCLAQERRFDTLTLEVAHVKHRGQAMLFADITLIIDF